MDDVSFALLLGVFLGGFVVGFMYLFIIANRRLQLRTYLHEVQPDDSKLVMVELLSIEHTLRSLSDKTNLTFFKSWYNSMQELLAFINKRKLP